MALSGVILPELLLGWRDFLRATMQAEALPPRPPSSPCPFPGIRTSAPAPFNDFISHKHPFPTPRSFACLFPSWHLLLRGQLTQGIQATQCFPPGECSHTAAHYPPHDEDGGTVSIFTSQLRTEAPTEPCRAQGLQGRRVGMGVPGCA